jgi:O-antigen/teichoic acid export membrane protein
MMQRDVPNVQSYFSNSVKNIIGTVVYFFCQWLSLIIIVHIAGYTISGEFSLVISFTNLFGFLSQYNIRNFQLSDIEHRFSPQQYSGVYIITSGIAVVLFIIALPLSGYNRNVLLCCLIYMLYKLCETFTMYIFTYMQLEDRFSNIAISFCLKGIIPLAGFTVALYFQYGLFLSLCAMTLLFSAVVILYDLPNIKEFFPRRVALRGTGHILKQCFPLMLSTLIVPFMLFLTRHTVQKIFGATELGYYSAFTMVIVVFSTMVGAVFVVFLPIISEKYLKRHKVDIAKIIFVMLGIILAATLIAIIMAHFIGNWVFSFVFDITILPYMYLLFPVIITSAMLAIMNFLSTCLIAMQKRFLMLLSMLTGVILLCILLTPATQSYGMLGTTNVFTLSLGIIVIAQGVIIGYNLLGKVHGNNI